jgi:hypothetical protein
MNVEKAFQLKVIGGVGNAPPKGSAVEILMGVVKDVVCKTLDVFQTENEGSGLGTDNNEVDAETEDVLTPESTMPLLGKDAACWQDRIYAIASTRSECMSFKVWRIYIIRF